MISSTIRGVLAAVCLLSVLPAQDLLIRGAKVMRDGSAQAKQADILIRKGRIEKIGQILDDPTDVPVIDALERVVSPGFVLAHSNEGLDAQNERMPLVPFISVVDAIDPGLPFFEDSLRDGHLTLNIMPGNSAILGGVGTIVHPFGLTVDHMVVRKASGMKISLVPRTGNRAGHLAKLRAALDRAHDELQHMEKSGRFEDEALTGNLEVDLEKLSVRRRDQNLMRVLKGEIPAYIACGTAADVVHAYRLMKDYGMQGHLVCGPGTWRAAPLIAKKKQPVILSPIFETEEKDPDTGKSVRRVIPKIFHDAGVRFAVTSASSRTLGRRYLWYQAAALVRYGIPRDVAFAAITQVPADVLGLGKQKGSLAKGKDADLLILTDDPFSGQAWVDLAIIGGKVAYNRAHDAHLSEIFGAKTR